MNSISSVMDGPTAALARVEQLQQLITQSYTVPSSGASTFAQTLAGAAAAPTADASSTATDADSTAADSTSSSPFASTALPTAIGDQADSTTASSIPSAQDATASTASCAAYGTTDTEATASGTSSAPADDGNGAYDGLISQAAAKYGIDPALLHGLIQQESDYNPDAVSSAGAEGLTQIMPFNFQSLGVTDAYDPAQSIDAGAHLLRENLDTFNGNVVDAVAAYNAGSGAVQQYGGVPPYPETQDYVQKVLANAQAYRASAGTSTVATTGAASAVDDTTAGVAPDTTAVPAGTGTITLPTVNNGGSFTTYDTPAALSAYAQQTITGTDDSTPTTGGSIT
jgi:soluble lytic murein transglycosylase-like protein